MGMRITPSGNPRKQRLVTFFNPTSSKTMSAVKLPPRTENRSATKRRPK
jgi:hypothetical protein